MEDLYIREPLQKAIPSNHFYASINVTIDIVHLYDHNVGVVKNNYAELAVYPSETRSLKLTTYCFI